MATNTPKTMSVPAAGKHYLGLGRNASYEAAHRGDIPTIKVNKLLRVPVIQMEKRLAGEVVEAWSHGAAERKPAT
jgi:hypothetical protein